MHIRVFNDPTHTEYAADRKDDEVSQDLTCTVTMQGGTVTVDTPACDHFKTSFGLSTSYTNFIHVTAHANPPCLSSKIEWTAFEPEVSPAKYHKFFRLREDGMYEEVANPVGPEFYLRFYGQPSNNASFPLYWVRATMPSASVHTRPLSLFFDGKGTKNPINKDNFYYYWKQTTANQGNNHTLDDGFLEPNFFGSCSFPQGVVKIGTGANTVFTGGEGSPYECYTWDGIDLFAVTCRHEAVHSAHYHDWWNNTYPNDQVQDSDEDGVPDAIEVAANAEYGSMDPDCYGRRYHFYNDNPFSNNGWGDEEILTQLEQLYHSPWTQRSLGPPLVPGAADPQDWSSTPHPHQYRTGCM